jgi:Zn finger protein HypA/HybF involved in hydrogenase expression
LVEVVKGWENSGLVMTDWAKRMIKMILESQQYLRTDFKIHVKGASRSSDHCSIHALSDPVEKAFENQCTQSNQPHYHDLRCPRCGMSKHVLNVQEMAQNILERKRGENIQEESLQIPEIVIIVEQEFHDIKKGQVDGSYKEILQGQILWEGVTATFLQGAVTGRCYWGAVTVTQINTLQLHT